MTKLSQDILKGAEEIGNWIGVERERVYVLVSNFGFPIFKLGNIISARKSTINKWIEAQEQKASNDNKLE